MIETAEEDWNPSQWQWLTSTASTTLMCAGLGAGKSTAGIAKCLLLKGANGRLPGLIIAQTYGALYNNIVDPMMSMLERSLPEQLVPRIVGRNTGKDHMLWADNSKTLIRSAEKPKSYDGANAAWLYGDEIRHWKKEAHEIAIARVRIKTAPLMQKAFTSTPGMGWMSEEFDTDKPGREVIRCGTIENAHNLAEGYIDDIRLSYSPRLQRAMLEGYFTILEGAVYDALPPNIWDSEWVVDHDPKKHKRCKTYLAVDPGYRRSAWLWIHEITPTSWVVFDQIMPDERSDDACVAMVNARGWPIDEIWCDPAADATQSALNLDTIAMLKGIKLRTRHSVRYISGPFRSVTFGVDKMRTLLGEPVEGLPIRVKFARRLQKIERRSRRGIVKDLMAYHYPEAKNGKALGGQPLKDGLTDHSNDALRYWGVGMWLTSPLRQLDKRISDMAQRGYHAA